MEKNSWIVVITTVITVAGTIAVAIINRTPAKVETTVVEPVRPAPPAEPGGERTDPVRPVTTDVPAQIVDPGKPVEPPSRPLPTPAAATVAGAWHDSLHRSYTIVVSGNMARLTGPEFPMGMMAQTDGIDIQWNFTQPNGNAGSCGGNVTGEQLNIICNSLAGSMPFPLHRPSS